MTASPPRMGEAGEDAAPPQALLERLKDYGQEQTLAHWQELNDEERELLIRDLEVDSHCCLRNCAVLMVPARL